MGYLDLLVLCRRQRIEWKFLMIICNSASLYMSRSICRKLTGVENSWILLPNSDATGSSEVKFYV